MLVLNALQAQQQLEQHGEHSVGSLDETVTLPEAARPRLSPRALPRTATPARGDLALQLPDTLDEV